MSDLTTEELTELKNGRSRHPLVCSAKRALKLSGELLEIEAQLDAHAPRQPGTQPILQGATAPASQLALVPVVRTANPTARLPGDASTPLANIVTQWYRDTARSPSGRALLHVMALITWVLSWAPVGMIYLVLFYVLICVVYVLMHPGLLIVALFKMLDAMPQYANFVAESLVEQIKFEMRQRLR